MNMFPKIQQWRYALLRHRLFYIFIVGLFATGLWPVPAAAKAPWREGYDIYLLIGQSNMAGRGTMIATDSTTELNGVYLLNADGRPEPAVAPLNRYSTIRKDLRQQQIGLGVGFGETMHRLTGRRVLLVVNARGGSSITAWSPADDHRYLAEAVRRTRQALPYGTLRGILWHQGETDVEKSTAHYAERFQELADMLRITLAAPTVPMVVGQLGQWAWCDERRIAAFNDSTLALIGQRVPRCAVVSSLGLHRLGKESDPHFGREAQLELGRRYAEALLPLVSDVYVAPYRGNRHSAVSLTFDDGYAEHATLVAPQLEQRGLRGTFFVNGATVGHSTTEKPRVTWSQLATLSAAGHEVSNHSWSHPKLTRLSDAELLTEILRNDSAIEQATGIRPITFCYPYNARDAKIERVASNGRVGTRTRQIGVGQQNNKTTASRLDTWLAGVETTGDWGVTMTHGITIGYDKWYQPELLWAFFDSLQSASDRVWVAPFSAVAAYRTERDNFHLQVRSRRHGYLLIPHLSLDRSLFTTPLTLIVRGDWHGRSVEVRQDGRQLDVVQSDDVLMFDVHPGGGRIRLKWRRAE